MVLKELNNICEGLYEGDILTINNIKYKIVNTECSFKSYEKKAEIVKVYKLERV
ncbi:MAG: hypothetical protein GY714_20765 [Desulfobacterales bacterium]|nr:hypothetical protein [Desulfobacterales bacterium]